MKAFLLISLFLVSSCALFAPTGTKKEMVTVPNATFWLGKSGDELTLHPIFAAMSLETRKTTDGIELRTFQSGKSYVSNTDCSYDRYSASCRGSGNERVCSHVFYLKNNHITSYLRVGPCGFESFQHRPLDENGNPVMAQSEIEFLARNVASDGTLLCKATSECGGAMSCQNGKCQNLGIWGRLFNR